jgi:hypothetical protein
MNTSEDGDAKIILNDRSSLFDCTVRNLTNCGACLEIASPIGIPQQFEISFDRGRSSRPCTVIWQANDQIGIEFG